MSAAVAAYIQSLPPERQPPFAQLLEVIRKNIAPGFKEVMAKAPAFLVPLEAFPAGYHCTPNTPLHYLNLVSQKNFIVLHHFGIYMNPRLLQWFVAEYPNHSKAKLDIGKACIRFKKMDQIPYELIGKLIARQSMEDFVGGYQSALDQRKK